VHSSFQMIATSTESSGIMTSHWNLPISSLNCAFL
jgi:hypothetical protein